MPLAPSLRPREEQKEIVRTEFVSQEIHGNTRRCHLRQESADKGEWYISKTMIKLAMLYGTKCWAMRKTDEHLLKETELTMLRWIAQISRLRDNKVILYCIVLY